MLKKSSLQVQFLLLVAFGGLLLLIAAVGLNALSILKTIQDRNRVIRHNYLQREGILEPLRSAIYLNGTYVRDLLLEPNPDRAPFHLAELRDSRAQIESLVAQYGRILRPAEAPAFASFRRELNSFFESIEPALGWSPQERRVRGYVFTQNSLLPQRMQIVKLTDQLRQLNEQQLAEDGRQIDSLFGRFRSQAAFLLICTFGSGLVLAVLSFWRILHLEREADRRFGEIAQARGDLRDLSTRLVQAQESERKAISRELHDEVGQALSGLGLGIANLAATVRPAAGSAADIEFRQLRKVAERTVSTVRDISLLLRPSMLDDLGLVAALEWQAREVVRTSGLRVHVQADTESEELPEAHKICIYRVVQEALRNAIRHAQASEAIVSLTQTRDRLMLDVSDNGRGFTPAREKGMGLLGMEERVNHLGGLFRVTSRVGEGSRIYAELPLQNSEERASISHEP